MSQPQYVIISGIDGSGKTTIIEGVRKELHSRGKSTCYVWLRYNHVLVKPIHAIGRLVGLSRRRSNEEGKIVWHHEFYRCRPFCGLYILLTYVDSLLGRLRIWNIARRAKPDVFICDRWVLDILIDLVIDTRRPALLRGGWPKMFTSILPENTRQYLIKRDAKDILDARPEYCQDREFRFRQIIYDRLEKQEGVTVINNNRSVSDAAELIVRDVDICN